MQRLLPSVTLQDVRQNPHETTTIVRNRAVVHSPTFKQGVPKLPTVTLKSQKISDRRTKPKRSNQSDKETREKKKPLSSFGLVANLDRRLLPKRKVAFPNCMPRNRLRDVSTLLEGEGGL